MNEAWQRLKTFTSARIALERRGHAVSTRHLLDLSWAHARARAAVHAPWDTTPISSLFPTWSLTSRARSREEFLKRPDHGRELSDESRAFLSAPKLPSVDLACCVSDGLSSLAVERHFLPLWTLLAPAFDRLRLTRAPLILVPYGRVAVADPIGRALGAKLTLIFLGERPGLSAADSLGVYLTYAPQPGLPDSRRNCISNIRTPDGLPYTIAARKIVYLVVESLRRQLSGVQLKEESGSLPPLALAALEP